MRKLATAAGLLLLSTLVLAACGDDDDEDTSGGTEPTAESGAQTVEIVATDFAFEPTEVSAEPGQAVTVTLKNDGAVEHSFTIDDLDVEAEAEGGEEATAEFTAPAESVEFHCRYHPAQMRGTVTVADDAGGAAAPTQDSSDSGGYGY
jgi:plastocyanin